jgi:hypothetical protein
MLVRFSRVGVLRGIPALDLWRRMNNQKIRQKLEQKLDQVNAKIESTQDTAKRKKMLARRRQLKFRTAQLSPGYKPRGTRPKVVGLKLPIA